jgi:hypothetical protein
VGTVVQVWKIVDALEIQIDESASYLDRETGEVETVSTTLMGLAEEGEEEPYLLAWQHAEWELARLIARDGERFFDLPTKFDIHEWQIMEDFSEHQQEPLRSDLRSAIHRSGAFRIFKDTLRRRGRIETWYKFRERALHEIAVEWLKDHGVPYSEAPNPARKR